MSDDSGLSNVRLPRLPVRASTWRRLAGATVLALGATAVTAALTAGCGKDHCANLDAYCPNCLDPAVRGECERTVAAANDGACSGQLWHYGVVCADSGVITSTPTTGSSSAAGGSGTGGTTATTTGTGGTASSTTSVTGGAGGSGGASGG